MSQQNESIGNNETLAQAASHGHLNILIYAYEIGNGNILLMQFHQIQSDVNTQIQTNKTNLKHALNTLEEITFENMEKLSNKINDSCVICLEEFAKDENTFTQLECHHLFHKKCIIDIKQNVCPLCREPIIKILNT
jgi:hypothetical protein